MTLKGNLRDFSIIQLLNLIHLANKSGALYLERTGEASKAFFHNGKLAYAESREEIPCLLNVLATDHLVTRAQFKLLTDRFGDANDRELGIYLENAGYASIDQVLNVMEDVYIQIFKHTFSWPDGTFRFETGEFPPENRVPVQVDLENLIVEGARELKEIEELRAEIPSLEMALKFLDRPDANLGKVRLNAKEWNVISFVNPKNTIQQIADTTKLDEIEIRRVVYTLLQAGLVEIIRPAGQPLPLPGKSLPAINPAQRRSLVQRLIDRIRSI